MATIYKNLSDYDQSKVPSGKDMSFGIVLAEWNEEITHALAKGAINTLLKHGVSEDNILIRHVPGTFELTLGAQFFAEYENVDGVICIGAVVRGETPHFDYICQGVTQGITQLNINYNIPVVFGVLTTNDMEQAKDRAGGKHGNKGDEAAITAIKMVDLHDQMEANNSDYPSMN
jgi:6,7-dimethyl-8-ribityllumazine synthase